MVSSAKNSSRSTLAGLAPVRDHPLGLARDRLGVAAQRLIAQRAVAEHLLALLGRRVEDHALPKIGFMNGYAAAWSSCSSGARKNASCAASP